MAARISTRIYLHGPPVTGKSTRLAARLVQLIGDDGVRPDRILLLVPQQAQAAPFRAALATIRTPGRARGEPELGTLYGLAKRHLSLFWPLVAAQAGFAQPAREPMFINVELAQYFLDRFVEPRLAEFEDLKLFRPRLLGQILDSMNKAAECGFGLDEIASRLSAAWHGELRRAEHFSSAQRIALEFRAFCLQHNLLDFSLLIETWSRHLLHTPTYEGYLAARYRHVLADNVEENPPVAHDLLRLLLPSCESALLVEDDPGGFRLFLGADPESARLLAASCDTVEATQSAQSVDVAKFGERVATQFDPQVRGAADPPAPLLTAPTTIAEKYWSGMVARAAERVLQLVADGAAPDDIAVLAPFVEDVLRFELSEHLAKANIAVRVLRPSRPLVDHPAVRACITLARLAHPDWQQPVSAPELARALAACIHELDIPRAQLLADAALAANPRALSRLEDQAMWTRVGMRFFALYHALVDAMGPPAEPSAPFGHGRRLDVFWQGLFSSVLSQPGFGPHHDLDAASACAHLIESARTFHDVCAAMPETVDVIDTDGGRAYITLLSQGIMAATPQAQAAAEPEHGVLLAPVYTFLTHNLRAAHMVWLDVSTLGWYERLRQPLTHPHVLSRRVPAGTAWTEQAEHLAQRSMTARVLRSLTLRCSDSLTLAQSQLSLTGQEDDGPLARAARNALAGR